jgi:lytic murein transglycosylase
MRCRRRTLRLEAALLSLALAGPAFGAPPTQADTPAQTPSPPPVPAAGPEASVPAPADCLGEIARAAEIQGVPAAIAARLTDLPVDPEVVAATQNQAEFVKPIWAYLDANLTEVRIATGRAKLVEWAPTLAAIEARYGVDRHILVAFWGVESTYGSVLDDPGIVRPVLRSLATLACTPTPRAPYWRGELVAALQILAQDRPPAEPLTGSWAGAMGHTQFMPTVYQAYAVDFDGDWRRDIWTSVPDALASTANYLTAMGWRPGERWGSEARLDPGFDYALADETTERSFAAWRALGAAPVQAPADDGAGAVLIVPAGARGPAFLLQPNFRMILRYNTALSYALTVAHLADRLRGAPAFERDWPRGDAMLSADALKGLQARLAELGFAPGAADGKPGPRTRAALRAFQAARGLVPDGYADPALVERIKAGP